MAPKNKKRKAAEKAYARNREGRRTRKNESHCVEHLHDALLKAGENIVEITADDRDRKADECTGFRTDLSILLREMRAIQEAEEAASQIFRAKNTNATAMFLKPIYDDSHMLLEDADLVNSRFNLVLIVAMYRKDDSYQNLCAHAASVAQQIDFNRGNGITVNGRHWRVKIPVGGRGHEGPVRHDRSLRVQLGLALRVLQRLPP